MIRLKSPRPAGHSLAPLTAVFPAQSKTSAPSSILTRYKVCLFLEPCSRHIPFEGPSRATPFFLFFTTAFFHEHFFSFRSASPSSHTCPTINFPFDGAHLPGILSRAQRSPSAASLNHHPRPRWQLNHPSAA